MNKTNNRTIDRIDLLFALLGITDNKDKNLIIIIIHKIAQISL